MFEMINVYIFRRGPNRVVPWADARGLFWSGGRDLAQEGEGGQQRGGQVPDGDTLHGSSQGGIQLVPWNS